MKSIKLFNAFLESEKSGGFVLIFCTFLSLFITNYIPGDAYRQFWEIPLGSMTISNWINDGLMAFFFLMIGLELKREFLEGQLSNMRNAVLPVFAAIGGMIVPAGLHLLLNYGTDAQAGAGIPIATDVAFALAALAILGKRVPVVVKVFLIALAVIDDLCAILVIAIFYTQDIHWVNLGLSLLIFAALMVMNRYKVNSLLAYLAGGAAIWYFMHHSGVHATIAGVLLAIAIPYTKGDPHSLSMKLQYRLHLPVAFIILPLFAMANTCIVISGDLMDMLAHANSMGIMLGLVAGKPIGVLLFSFLAVITGVGALHPSLQWKHVAGIGMLAGIGFTISIFISLLAFTNEEIIDQSKMAILIASVISAMLGSAWLLALSKRKNRLKKIA